jgi:hypothetical protein
MSTEDIIKKVNVYFKNTILYPSLIVIVVMVVFSRIDNYGYKSEWFTADVGIFISIITAIIYSLIIGLLSLPIFLNRIERVRKNLLLRILSWFLFPFGFIAIVFTHEIIFSIKYTELTSWNNFVYVLILNIPFIIGLIWGFLSFSNYLKENRLSKE